MYKKQNTVRKDLKEKILRVIKDFYKRISTKKYFKNLGKNSKSTDYKKYRTTGKTYNIDVSVQYYKVVVWERLHLAQFTTNMI